MRFSYFFCSVSLFAATRVAAAFSGNFSPMAKTLSNKANYFRRLPVINDECSDAITVLVPSTTSGSTVGASEGGPGPTACSKPHNSRDVYYKVAGTGYPIVASTCDGTYDLDTIIGVVDACTTTATCLGSNHDADPACSIDYRLSRIVWESSVGTDYYIWVRGRGGGQGDFNLRLTRGCDTASDPEWCIERFPTTDVSPSTTLTTELTMKFLVPREDVNTGYTVTQTLFGPMCNSTTATPNGVEFGTDGSLDKFHGVYTTQIDVDMALVAPFGSSKTVTFCVRAELLNTYDVAINYEDYLVELTMNAEGQFSVTEIVDAYSRAAPEQQSATSVIELTAQQCHDNGSAYEATSEEILKGKTYTLCIYGPETIKFSSDSDDYYGVSELDILQQNDPASDDVLMELIDEGFKTNPFGSLIKGIHLLNYNLDNLMAQNSMIVFDIVIPDNLYEKDPENPADVVISGTVQSLSFRRHLGYETSQRMLKTMIFSTNVALKGTESVKTSSVVVATAVSAIAVIALAAFIVVRRRGHHEVSKEITANGSNSDNSQISI